jgi:hypothetical protein
LKPTAKNALVCESVPLGVFIWWKKPEGQESCDTFPLNNAVWYWMDFTNSTQKCINNLDMAKLFQNKKN